MYFLLLLKAYEENSRTSQTESTTKNDESENDSTNQEGGESWPNEKRNKILAGCAATTAMLGYAYASGLVDVVRNIEIRIGDDEEDEEEEYE